MSIKSVKNLVYFTVFFLSLISCRNDKKDTNNAHEAASKTIEQHETTNLMEKKTSRNGVPVQVEAIVEKPLDSTTVRPDITQPFPNPLVEAQPQPPVFPISFPFHAPIFPNLGPRADKKFIDANDDMMMIVVAGIA